MEGEQFDFLELLSEEQSQAPSSPSIVFNDMDLVEFMQMMDEQDVQLFNFINSFSNPIYDSVEDEEVEDMLSEAANNQGVGNPPFLSTDRTSYCDYPFLTDAEISEISALNNIASEILMDFEDLLDV